MPQSILQGGNAAPNYRTCTIKERRKNEDVEDRIAGGPNKMPIKCLELNQGRRQSERNGDWQIAKRGLSKIPTNPEAKNQQETVLREHKSRLRRIQLKSIGNQPDGTSSQYEPPTLRTIEVAKIHYQ